MLVAAVAAAPQALGADAAAPRIQDLQPRILDMPARVANLENTVRTTTSDEQVEVDISADVLFAFGSARLSAEARTKLDEVAADIAEQASGRVLVVGHTDSKGDAAYNQRLSEQRAAAVRDALLAATGDAVTYEVRGMGETQPIAAETTQDGQDNPAGRQRNRRVVVSYDQ